MDDTARERRNKPVSRGAATQPRWHPAIIVVWLLLLLSHLACNGSGRVEPDDPIIQPPIVDEGTQLDEFMRWIEVFPPGEIPPPWIVQPLNNTYIKAEAIEVRGWAVNASDRPDLGPAGTVSVVTLYAVDGPTYPPTMRERLAEAMVAESREWAISEVALPLWQDSYLAAKVSIGGHMSGWSNIVAVLRTGPPSIDFPKDGDVFAKETRTISMSGSGPPGSTLTVYRGSHAMTSPGPPAKEMSTTTVDAGGHWVIRAVRLYGGDSYLFAKVTAAGEGQPSNEIRVHKTALTWPLPVEHKTISQWFGECYRGRKYESRHLGLDIAVNGVEVLAAADGKVRLFRQCVDQKSEVACVKTDTDCRAVNCDGCGCGHFILIDHDKGEWKGYRTYYGHLGEFKVSDGQRVAAGQVIGVADNTGSTTGSHLHFEVWRRDFGGRWTVVNTNPGHGINGVFPGIAGEGDEQAWWWGEGDDLMAVDWDQCTAPNANNTLQDWAGDRSCNGNGAGCEWECLSTFDFNDMGCSDGVPTEAVFTGQVLNKDRKPIKGAQLEIWLDGARWDSPSNPVTTDDDGTYQFSVQPGQRVRFESLVTEKSTRIISPEQPELATLMGCIRTVNFVQVSWTGQWQP